MDRNQSIGLILMFGLLAAYFLWFSPEPPLPQEVVNNQEQTTPTPSAATSTPVEDVSVAIPDSVMTQMNSQKFGIFSFAANAREVEKMMENEELKITFSSQGGRVKEVILKKHKDYLGNPLILVDGTKSKSEFIVDQAGKKINLSDLSFSPSTRTVGDTTVLTYKLSGEGFSIEQTYQIPSKGFEVGYNVKTSGLNSILSPTDIAFNWNHAINRAESNLVDGRINSNVRYLQTDGEYDELAERSTEYEEATLGLPLKWISFKQKFFTAGVIANTSFKSGFVSSKVDESDTTSVKYLTMNLAIPYTDFVNGFGYNYFFGPNNYDVLRKVTPEFEENLDMGWGPLPLVNKYLIIPIFHFLERFFTNYGIIILIIVIIIRLLLSPLTYKSHMSMAKMRVMKPELDELKAKHDGDQTKAQQEQMKLYQKVGINPLSGCIPMLLQMPILFSLFFFFPNAVELRQQAFLWAHDLSTYDSVLSLPFTIPFYGNHVSLFTILMTASTILYTWSNSQITTVQGPMKTLQYMMPIMFLFVLNSYSSGLTFYYFVSNMMTFGQVMLFRRLIDEDKIKAVLDENRKKNVNKKKSKFATRLEDAMKASQESQRQKKKKK
jgi:YidC/Oxa1 family membrane protein insertase